MKVISLTFVSGEMIEVRSEEENPMIFTPHHIHITYIEKDGSKASIGYLATHVIEYFISVEE